MTEEKRINIFAEEQDNITPAVKKQEQTEPQVEYASVPERLMALLIDYGVIFLPAQLLANLFWYFMGGLTPEGLLYSVAGINVLFILYETIFSCSDRVTLGKSLLGLAVVKKDLSGPLSFGKAFVRAIGYYLSGFLFMFGFLFAFFEEKRRAWHDFMAGSVVVRIRQKSGVEKLLVQFLGSLLLLLLGWMSYGQFFSGGSLLQQFYVKEAKKQIRNVALLEEAHYNRYGYYTNDLLRLSLLSGDPVQFQRDFQRAIRFKGFRIGVSKDGNSYKIMGYARDEKKTPVVFPTGK